MVPGDRPLQNLASSLAATCSKYVTDDVPAHGFANELRATIRRPNAPILVIVDQTEELITLSGERERNKFLNLL
jgi:hypothetical protein